MPEQRIKRYTLVPERGPDGVRRYHLARMPASSTSVPRPERLERMDEIAALAPPRDAWPERPASDSRG